MLSTHNIEIMALIGNIEHFNSKVHDFNMYLSRLEHLFKVNAIKDNLKVSMLIALTGPELFTTLTNLLAPESPESKSYQEIIDKLKGHYSPKKLEIAETFTFNKCDQKVRQSIAEYSVELKKLANTCNFGEFLERALRDRFVCGLLSEEIRRKLLSEEYLTFDKAYQIAINYERAESQAKYLQSGSGATHKLNKQQNPGTSARKNVSSNNNNRRKGKRNEQDAPQRNQCHRCGKWHNPATCPAKDLQCHSCWKMGHTFNMCTTYPFMDAHVVEALCAKLNTLNP